LRQCKSAKPQDLDFLIELVDYFYGRNAHLIFKDLDLNMLKLCYSKATGRLRAIVYGDEVFAFIRASDFRLIPRISMARLLHSVIPYPRHRIVVVNEIAEDVLEGHTVFSRHVLEGDESIKPFDEVLIVDENDRLIGIGRALISYEAIITALRGPAIRIREKVRERE
jgi:Prefoldin, molecular chaperone implicated in de novo protein folding, alpha subunit